MTAESGGVPPFVLAAGDDVTDEDSFAFLARGGQPFASILVAAPLHEEPSAGAAGLLGSVRATAATHYVRGPEELASLLAALHAALCVAPAGE